MTINEVVSKKKKCIHLRHALCAKRIFAPPEETAAKTALHFMPNKIQIKKITIPRQKNQPGI
jgi:hypothetical protein